MKISVIIPTFNSSATIVNVLNSIKSQSFQPYEIIIVDDGSNDNTLDLASKFDGVSVFALGDNHGGPAWPRNFGILKAKGDYIAFCDADDIWHMDKLRRQAEKAISHNAKFVSCRRKIIKSYDAFDTHATLSHSTPQTLGARDFLFGNPIVNSSVLIAREILEKNKFVENNKLVAVEDYELYERLHQDLKSIKLNEQLVGYLEVGQGISSRKVKMLKKFYIAKRMRYSFITAIFFTTLSIFLKILGKRAK